MQLNVDDGNVNYGDLISHFNCDTPPVRFWSFFFKKIFLKNMGF
jgi:hypothetical protein